MNKQDFYDGKMFDAYRYMGAHKKGDAIEFVTYAPNAEKISVIGEFNEWKEEFMEKEGQSGFFSMTSDKAQEGNMYKYCIYGPGGRMQEHCDPYGFEMELRPGACSIINDIGKYEFHDKKWMVNRSSGKRDAVNIYEMHLGSWRQNPEDENGWYEYDEIAEMLVPYIKENNYTHVELMPLSEHPFDGSWGYQNTGFFAPTKRYGKPEQLMKFVDLLHQAEIGVIIDFVPVHFAIDGYGLRLYDGTPLYEYDNRDTGESEWGSANFIHSRREVKCFLQSAANYWLEEYHFDGIRMDAVSRLIYWQGNESRGVNGAAIEFLKDMNLGLKQRHPDAMLIAEDSTSYPGVTKPVYQGGLGFDYKWDLGWMHDTLEYFQTPPKYRTRDYHKLTFSMMYYWNEQYLLEFCHDEVVHGKATILQKMYGDYDGKFPQARAMYLYMMMHPGKKLNFMGNEFGQLREWTEKQEQDWDVLKYPIHDAFHHYMKELNRIYKASAPLHDDYNPDNFRWLDCHQEERCIYAIGRKKEGEMLAAVFNFSDQEQKDYELEIEDTWKEECILNTDWDCWGGETPREKKTWELEQETEKTTMSITLAPYSGVLFELRKTKPRKAKKTKKTKK
ncbi:MAG TPA: 1,4-alpha-glucan branching protein GlgB [Candidatus Anaerostipes excrementavium]|uniref:1,4-alpha-glucan branching enzyme n=1 Tax=Candidatus Anaerostipes excrementavium TaxID=2838463 RepID=A0A9D1WX84_9FIRM|nr:1,4-alpha-glucan branching protein GlgB [uncultured Anaerostipes sp.]HIX68839.1 1,4-alpha-glucan branching protein GlgB [Candidatus Anaerostipes excrementavium]